MKTVENAKIIGFQAIEYIAGSPEQLDNLMRETGMDHEALLNCLQTSAGLAGILEYLCQDESVLLGFCEARGLHPNEPMRAAMSLQSAPDTGAM